MAKIFGITHLNEQGRPERPMLLARWNAPLSPTHLKTAIESVSVFGQDKPELNRTVKEPFLRACLSS